MPTIAVVNEKGGCGKTTVSTSLARGLQKQGYDVLLVDSDPQGNARDWYGAASEDNDLPPVVGLDRPALFKDLQSITQGHEWVVIDGAPQLRDLTVAALKASDHVIIPVQPSPYDIWATEPIVELVKARQEITDGRPTAHFLISRQIVGTKLAGDIRETLNEYGLATMNGITSQRVIYANSAITGSTALDAEPEGAAATEIRKLVEEVISWQNNPVSEVQPVSVQAMDQRSA